MVPRLFPNFEMTVIVLDADGLWYLTHGNTPRMLEVVESNAKNFIPNYNKNKHFC